MAPALLRVPSGPPALGGHPGEEFFLVVEGMVEFHMQYYAPLVMEAGDSVYFDAATPHAVIAVGNGEATILTIVSLAGQGHREGKILHPDRSEEHTSELQSLMRNSYAVFCLKKKKKNIIDTT